MVAYLGGAAVAALAGTLLVSTAFGAALLAWILAGVGVGLAYPTLYIVSTTPATGGLTAAKLATAVITAEAFGGVLGQAAGGAVVWLSATLGLPRSNGLTAAYGMFALFLFASAMAAARGTPASTPLRRWWRGPMAAKAVPEHVRCPVPVLRL